MTLRALVEMGDSNSIGLLNLNAGGIGHDGFGENKKRYLEEGFERIVL
jgi:hypothetical protein